MNIAGVYTPAIFVTGGAMNIAGVYTPAMNIAGVFPDRFS